MGHEHVAVGLGQIGGPSLRQAGHDIGRLGHGLDARRGRRLPPAPRPPSIAAANSCQGKRAGRPGPRTPKTKTKATSG